MEKDKALEAALSQIERAFGKGSIMRLGQNTNIINGVPEPAKNKNGVDNIINVEASKDTLLLNHRLSSKINKKPSSSPIKILGSLIV